MLARSSRGRVDATTRIIPYRSTPILVTRESALVARPSSIRKHGPMHNGKPQRQCKDGRIP
jgi:hypothetical protein